MSIDTKDNRQLQLYSELDSLKEYHGRHSYKVFKNIQTENSDLSKTLLNNCCLQNCRFINCKMDSVDYQGTEFINCVFFNVSFKGSDISSCIFKYCTFENCEFEATNFIDNNISLSAVKSTAYDCATVNNNIWTKCEFVNFAPDDTSMYSNEFIKCKFIKSELLTAIYFTVFDRCSFISSKIDSYILGFQFGLMNKDFKRLDIEHFDEKHVGYKRIRNLLHTIYEERNMPLENKILDLSFSDKLGFDVEQLVNLVFVSLSNGLVIKVDEIRFIRKIINNLYKENKISLFYYLFIIEKLKGYPVLNYRNTLSENVYNEITMFYHLLYSIKMEIESGYIQLCDILTENYFYLHNVQIELIYNRKPDFRVYEIIQQITNKEFLPVHESFGSFHESYEIAKEVLENISLIMAIFGTSILAITKAVKKFIKKKKEKKENSASSKQAVEATESTENREIVIEKYTSTDTYNVTEKKIHEIQNENSNTFIRETIFHKTVHTIIVHKEKIISGYDKKNLKKIVIK